MKEEIPGWAAYSEKGLKDEIEKRLDEVTRTGNKMADAFDIGFRERVGINSPSKIFAENGMYVVLGFN